MEGLRGGGERIFYSSSTAFNNFSLPLAITGVLVVCDDVVECRDGWWVCEETSDPLVRRGCVGVDEWT